MLLPVRSCPAGSRIARYAQMRPAVTGSGRAESECTSLENGFGRVYPKLDFRPDWLRGVATAEDSGAVRRGRSAVREYPSLYLARTSMHDLPNGRPSSPKENSKAQVDSVG
jgi:hypothetical protein